MTVLETPPPAAQLPDLLNEVRSVLTQSDRTSHLVDLVPNPDDDSPLRVALAGPYSAGKTLLVAGLLNLPADQIDELVAAEPKTTTVTEYRAPGYTLLDLPGTLSGLEGHDSEARKGIRRADALLIVTTTELPGESESAQIRGLLEGDGFAGRALVVVNKANAENSDREVIREEMCLRLGEVGASTAVLFTDAKDYRLARQTPGLTDEERAFLLADSGVERLSTAIDTMLAQANDPRGQAHRHEVARVLEAATLVWEPTLEEQAEATTAARLENALSAGEEEINAAISLILDRLRESVKGTGDRLAVEVSEKDGSIARASITRAHKEVTTTVAEATAEANDAVRSALEQLTLDFDSAADQHRRYAATFRSDGMPTPKADPVGRTRTDEAIRLAGEAAHTRAQRYLRDLASGDVRAGSHNHDLAKRVNGLLGRKPRPYVHQNLAGRMQAGAGRLETALNILGPVLDGKTVLDDVLRRNRISEKRKEIVGDYQRHADTVAQEIQEGLRGFINQELQGYRDAAGPIVSAVRAQDLARAEALERIAVLSARVLTTAPAVP